MGKGMFNFTTFSGMAGKVNVSEHVLMCKAALIFSNF
jgi:hypothetical protein